MNMKHELLGDIPIIIEFCKRLNLQSLIESYFPSHGNQEGLTNGLTTIGWIAHILTENNHCKSPVQQWQMNHSLSLETLLEAKIANTDFEDCRLGRLLQKFADNDSWHAFEASFYKDTFSVLELCTNAPASFKESNSNEDKISKTIKIDTTTAYGYHKVQDGGLMQRGWSKDHRPDLPQLKIMVAAEGNTGFQIASDIVPGNIPDDPLYIPILERTRKTVDTKNCLMCGDCKMSALEIKANIVQNGEFYLVPLALQVPAKAMLKQLVDEVVNGTQEAKLIFDINEKNESKIIGAGFEAERIQKLQDINNECKVQWSERVLLIRSYDHAKQEIDAFNRKIKKLHDQILKLTSKQCSNPETATEELLGKIAKFKEENDISEIFDIEIETSMNESEKNRSEKRNGVKRSGTYKVKHFKSKVLSVKENSSLVEKMTHKLGWRLYATNAPKGILTFNQAYKYFRKTMYVIEIGFHKVKDYINISPLYVRKEDQILGMTRLLMLALKILTLMTAEIRANMKKENIILKGLYAGQPARRHESPTAECILKYFSRMEIALIGQKIRGNWYWSITQLSDNCRAILTLLKIPETTYELIAERLQNVG